MKNTRIDAHETLKHAVCRRIGAYVLTQAGFSWDTEVAIKAPESDDRVDLVNFNYQDEPPIAIEFESNPTEKTKASKLDRYVKNGPCMDMLLLDIRDCPDDINEIHEWIKSELGF